MNDSTELVAVNELTTARKRITTAVAALKRQCQDNIGTGACITGVATIDEGWFLNSEHKVTGQELNKLIQEVQGALSGSAGQRRMLWNSLIEVYTTINSLDDEYLSKIDVSLNLINANYAKIKNNHQEIIRNQKNIDDHRRRIDELIDGHETALKVLRKFKERIDKLSHLEEVDKLLGRIDIEKSLKSVQDKANKVLDAIAAQANTVGVITDDLRQLRLRLDDQTSTIDAVKREVQTIGESLKLVQDKANNVSDAIAAQTNAVVAVKDDFHQHSLRLDSQMSEITSVKHEVQAVEDRMKKWVWGLSAAFLLVFVMALFALV